MRIVHTADWHVGKVINDYSMLNVQQHFFSQFIEDLKELKPDMLIIAGDLYDRSIPPNDAISLLNKVLCIIVLELKIPTFIIAGNHDSKERLSFLGDLLTKSGLHIAGNITKIPKKVSLNNSNIYMLPYLEPHNIKQFFPENEIKTSQQAIDLYSSEILANLDQNAINILIAHGNFGCYDDANETNVGGSDYVNASLFLPFDYVAFGHLHSYRRVSENMVNAGSPLKYSIKPATSKKSFTIVDIAEKGSITISTKEIIPLHDIVVLEGSFDDLINRNTHTDLNDYVFVNLTDDIVILNAISALKAVFPNILGLRYLYLNSTTIHIDETANTYGLDSSNQQLFSKFYNEVMNVPLSTEQQEYIDSVFNTCKGGIEDDSNTTGI